MERVRMDKWLWAARFFKTRAIAGEACDMGRIECGEVVCKASRDVKVGDVLRVRTGGNEYEVEVLIAGDVRGSGAVAATMYRETLESVARRVKIGAERRAMQEMGGWQESHRPTKRDRRDINRLRGR
ncbi:MAG: RNA-binding S4 domain-containing protein [Acidobacteria bacterium]|nr:RNA-binding S4 domain-containing protein [Acidobacteriota bacterium]